MPGPCRQLRALRFPDLHQMQSCCFKLRSSKCPIPNSCHSTTQTYCCTRFRLSSSLQTRPSSSSSSSPRHNLLACPVSSIIETQSPPDTQSLSLLLFTTSFPSLAQKSAKQVPRVFPNRKSQLAERYARPIVKQQSKGENKKELFLDDPTSFSYISRSQTSLFGFNCGGNNSIVWRS